MLVWEAEEIAKGHFALAGLLDLGACRERLKLVTLTTLPPAGAEEQYWVAVPTQACLLDGSLCLLNRLVETVVANLLPEVCLWNLQLQRESRGSFSSRCSWVIPCDLAVCWLPVEITSCNVWFQLLDQLRCPVEALLFHNEFFSFLVFNLQLWELVEIIFPGQSFENRG